MTIGKATRRRLDAGRLRNLVGGPGADPRVWVLLGRVDDEPDAVRFDVGTGWVADCTITSPELGGEGPIPCRVAQSYGGQLQGRLEPVARGCEVVLVLPSADTGGPVIVGYLANPTDCAVPTQVNGVAITEALALGTHVLVSPGDVRWQVGALLQLTAVLTELAAAGATQPFVRGEAQRASLDALLEALRAWTVAVSGALSAAGFPIVAAQAAFAGPAPPNAIDTAKAGLSAALSTRIRGE
jgi:hypothetical protein